MAVTADKMLSWCQTLLGQKPLKHKTLEDFLTAIPRLESLADVPAGTPVLIRGDVDAKPGATVGQGDERLRSMVETLKFGVERGWKMIVFGHIGRKPEGSLKDVAKRFSELLGSPVALLDDWLDESTLTISPKVTESIQKAPNGTLQVLNNTRRYDIERVLWKAEPDDLPELAPKLAKLANEFADKVAKVYVNEALSAGSLDASSTIVPASMDRVALGNYVAGEFDGPMRKCLQTELVIFSGLKIDKLDDLQAMIGRGTIRWVFAAGSLAMVLKKAVAELDGQEFSMGVAGDPAHVDKPYYIPAERVEQAKKMVKEGRNKGITFVLPVDFVLQDGTTSNKIGDGQQQLDVGPKTSDYFEQKIGEFLAAAKQSGKQPVVFHNGVFGWFEDPRFEEGTRRFVPQLKRMKEGGAAVYVGGGEGGKALEKYGQPDWVTHCFTAGGTVLNALGSAPVPYLQALAMAAAK